ncbi:hypothetical protein VB285_004454 [Salmonella enterica]|nr:hypothetical protein [Salmonella enterica]ELU3766305.1 hypothetical protein [Salmonella enterica]EMC1963996.1 hypothetical protein [Salmonella enterica]
MTTPAHRKALADKHGKTITGYELDEALKYIDNMQKGIKKEMDALDKEYTETLKKVENNPKGREAVERNYSHWRHVLVSVFEPLEDARAHWKHHGQNLTGEKHPEPRHTGTY